VAAVVTLLAADVHPILKAYFHEVAAFAVVIRKRQNLDRTAKKPGT
jgi:hypothetical protein